jgi:hypothetical protein
VGGPDIGEGMSMGMQAGYGVGGYTTSAGTPLEGYYEGLHRGVTSRSMRDPARGRQPRSRGRGY